MEKQTTDHQYPTVNEVMAMLKFVSELRSGGTKNKFKTLKRYGIKAHGFIDSAEGIRIPFDREKARKRAESMRLLAELDVTIDRILSDDSERDTTN